MKQIPRCLVLLRCDMLGTSWDAGERVECQKHVLGSVPGGLSNRRPAINEKKGGELQDLRTSDFKGGQSTLQSKEEPLPLDRSLQQINVVSSHL